MPWLLAALVLAGPMLAPVHAESADRAALQAEFVARIARFVDWPEGTFSGASDPIRVGVLAEDKSLDPLAQKLREARSGKRGFAVKRLDQPEQAEKVHIVIVADTGKRAMRRVARQLKGKPVLSIATSFDFAEDGGILGMEIYRGKVAFEVNNESARKADLKISSRVLRLASNVY